MAQVQQARRTQVAAAVVVLVVARPAVTGLQVVRAW
jgi:hypothetical protein